MENYTIPTFVIENKFNNEVPYQYFVKYGNNSKYENDLFEKNDSKYFIKPAFIDLVTRVSHENASISFNIVNDASVAGRRFQETYICETPLCYTYDNLIELFDEKIPKVRQRNSPNTYLEPIISNICAKYMILCALIESVFIKEKKQISFTITSKSIKINYSYDSNIITTNFLEIKKDYFKAFGLELAKLENDFNSYVKQHRINIRSSYDNGMKTIEIMFNVRSMVLKKYSIIDDEIGLLTKSEYDIYNFIKGRNGASLKLIADEFGYNSSRSAKYHMDKLKAKGLVERVGMNKSHNCYYRALI